MCLPALFRKHLKNHLFTQASEQQTLQFQKKKRHKNNLLGAETRLIWLKQVNNMAARLLRRQLTRRRLVGGILRQQLQIQLRSPRKADHSGDKVG